MIVGAGHAGGRSVASLRGQGYKEPITLIGAEPHLPYERPPLSKGALTGAQPVLSGQLYDEDFYSKNEVRMRLGHCVESISTARRLVYMDSGETIGYDSLIVATGARPRRLEVTGEDLPGVYYLRTAQDAQAIKEAVRPGMRCCVIGAGFIGLETAASLTIRGCSVHVIERDESVLSRVAPRSIGDCLQRLHESRGVKFSLGATVERIDGRPGAIRISTESGDGIAADLVIIGIGAEPEVGLAQRGGIACGNGILVDQYGRSDIDGVFAVGDVANFWHPRLARYVRLESWANAQHAPSIIARNICGQAEPYAPISWLWTDQYETNIQILDLGVAPDDYVLRGSLDVTERAIYFGLTKGAIVSAWLINYGRERRPITRLIEREVSVTESSLADESVSLRHLSEQIGHRRLASEAAGL